MDRAFKRNDDGQLVIGDPEKGCPFCGQVGIKYAGDGGAVLYHAALTCCPPRVVQELFWRIKEIQRFERRVQDAEDEAQALERQIIEAEEADDKREAARLRNQRPQARSAVENRRREADRAKLGGSEDEREDGLTYAVNVLVAHLRRRELSPHEIDTARRQALAQEGGSPNTVELKALEQALYRAGPLPGYQP